MFKKKGKEPTNSEQNPQETLENPFSMPIESNINLDTNDMFGSIESSLNLNFNLGDLSSMGSLAGLGIHAFTSPDLGNIDLNTFTQDTKIEEDNDDQSKLINNQDQNTDLSKSKEKQNDQLTNQQQQGYTVKEYIDEDEQKELQLAQEKLKQEELQRKKEQEASLVQEKLKQEQELKNKQEREQLLKQEEENKKQKQLSEAEQQKEIRRKQQLELEEYKKSVEREKQVKKQQEIQQKQALEEQKRKQLEEERNRLQKIEEEKREALRLARPKPLSTSIPVFEKGSFEVDGVNYDLIELRIIQHILNFAKLNVDQLRQGAEAYITSEQFDICSIQSMVSKFKEFKDLDNACKCIACQKECGLMLEQTRIAALCLNCAQPHSVSIQQLNQFANRSFIDQNNSKSRFNEKIQTALELKRIIQLYQHATRYQKLKDQIHEIADIQICQLSLLQMAMFYNNDMLQIPEESQPLILAFASKCGQLFEHYKSLQYLPAHYAFRDTYENTPVGQYGFVWFLILAFQDRFSQCQQSVCCVCNDKMSGYYYIFHLLKQLILKKRIGLSFCEYCLRFSHIRCNQNSCCQCCQKSDQK
ncbi:titin-like [Hexamita inflata]|uniref:Titin-like n=1 Tax=Hexamita inflata TaxID=28002 RepID=A0AA86V1T8_9EUKA|nr:titin-like [Hexamita inflata]